MIRTRGCSEARTASLRVRGRSGARAAAVRAAAGLLALDLGWGGAGCARGDASAQLPPARTRAAARPTAPLVVRVLDVGQGDAVYIENGGSRVLVDGGPEPAVMGRKLDALGLHDDTLDVVVLTHEHADHAGGLRAVFERRRHITVRYFFENEDPHTGYGLAQLRDSVGARAARGELVLRDTDDPCANGQPTCTINLRGGARLRILRPPPAGRGGVPAGNPNNRSVALKLVAPDSAAFTMWLAGDAQRQELAWFDRAGYARDPGMRVDVLKADHHGSCNGITGRYLDRTRPRYVIVSVGARNSFGHVHEQAKTLLRARQIPWYRTDRNGDIVMRVPAGAGANAPASFSITPTRGPPSADGTSDRFSTQASCRQP